MYKTTNLVSEKKKNKVFSGWSYKKRFCKKDYILLI